MLQSEVDGISFYQPSREQMQKEVKCHDQEETGGTISTKVVGHIAHQLQAVVPSRSARDRKRESGQSQGAQAADRAERDRRQSSKERSSALKRKQVSHCADSGQS